MRELKAEEATKMFEKLSIFIGDDTQKLLERPDGNFVFRMIGKHIYYMSSQLAAQASIFAAANLHQVGVMVGKMTHHNNFHINVTALALLEQFAKHKLWVTKAGEQQFVYGQDIIRQHVMKMTDGIPSGAGIVVFNEQDGAIGFGVMTRSGIDAQRADFNCKIVIHQSDVGEYLRDQDTMF